MRHQEDESVDQITSVQKILDFGFHSIRLQVLYCFYIHSVLGSEAIFKSFNVYIAADSGAETVSFKFPVVQDEDIAIEWPFRKVVTLQYILSR